MSTSARLAGRMAVVTGGSSGIGAACVRALAAEGAGVVIGYHAGRDRAEALMATLPAPSGKAGHRCAAIPLAGDGMAEAHAALADSLPRLDILVNSAGFTRRIPHADLDALTPALFNEIVTANLGGTYAVTRALLPRLAATGDAVVVSVSSVSAFTGQGSNIAYCAAKAALDTMTMSLARAFGPAVRLLCVSPASVDTGFVAGRNRDELIARTAKTPLGRLVTPEDVALAVLGCITHMTTATGTRVVIDGGHVL